MRQVFSPLGLMFLAVLGLVWCWRWDTLETPAEYGVMVCVSLFWWGVAWGILISARRARDKEKEEGK